MMSPSDEKRIVAMVDSFTKTVARNFSRNLKRAKANAEKHYSDEPVDYLLEFLSHEDRYPSDHFVLYADELSCVVHSETLYKALCSLPEPWRFKNPIYLTKNPDTPILERYIHAIFKKQLIDYKDERNPSSAADYFHIENEFCCFHTGLYTRRYKAIYACFDRNKKKDSLLEWYFRGFADELSPMLRHISPLPKKPSYYMTQYGVNYNPEWPIRVNVDHILGDTENLSRIPVEIREAQNLPLLLETAVELARRKAVVEPSIVVPQGYQGRVQYLLPICLTDMEQPDLAMTLTIMDGYYLGNTCLTLEMAYLNARLLSRPVAHWLTDIVEE